MQYESTLYVLRPNLLTERSELKMYYVACWDFALSFDLKVNL